MFFSVIFFKYKQILRCLESASLPKASSSLTECSKYKGNDHIDGVEAKYVYIAERAVKSLKNKIKALMSEKILPQTVHFEYIRKFTKQ